MKTRKVVSAVILASLVAVAPAARALTSDQACFSPVVGWGVPAPVIDGVIHNDSGWNQAFRYRFQYGTSTDAAIQLSAAGGKIYVSVEVSNDKSYDIDDTIVIAFQQASGSWRRIMVRPLPAGGGSGAPFKVYNDTSTTTKTIGTTPGYVNWPGTPTSVFSTTSAQTAPDDSADYAVWSTVSGISTNSATGSWITEIAFPHTLVNGPDLGVFVGIAKVDAVSVSKPAVWYTWPKALGPQQNTLDLTTDTPLPTGWGHANVSATSCPGAYPVAISTVDPANPGDPGSISKNSANGFKISVKNDRVAVNNVTATFRWGSWGVPLSWTDTGVTTTPTNIPADGATYTIASSISYTPGAEGALGHVCLMGELTSSDGDAVFSQRSMIINTHWGAMSEYVDEPFIQTSKLELGPGQRTAEIEFHYYPTYQYAMAAGEIPSLELGAVTSQVHWNVEVFLRTGRELIIEGRRYPLLAPLGAFAQVLQHQMPADFAKQFLEKYAKEIAKLMDGEGEQNKQAGYRRINEMLANQDFRPPAADFQLQIPALTPVRGAKGFVFTATVEAGKDLPLKSIASYVGKGGGTGPTEPTKPPRRKTCGCGTSDGTSPLPSVAFLTLMVLGLLRYRRPGRV